jgi:hypothetical protein
MNKILKISIISKIINKIDEILCRMLEKNPFVFLTTGAIFFSSIIYLLIYLFFYLSIKFYMIYEGIAK